MPARLVLKAQTVKTHVQKDFTAKNVLRNVIA